ncbi:MAG TPA: hypothetical protein VFZ65_11455 [Planctomycetota bacterium]|nr:hypothetical protein [Planctomycetota bacterium]
MHRLGVGLAGVLALALAPSQARAQVNIVRVLGAGAPPATVAGGGNLTAIFNAAADWWEGTLVTSPYTVTITYQWGPLSGSTLGLHSLVSQGGSPNRETAGTITFDNDGTSSWFLDPTPCANTEFTTGPTLASANLGGGLMNTGRTYTGGTGSASGRTDLFSVCLHEIGHALGLSSANTSFVAEAGVDLSIDVTAPRPFPGAAIPTVSGAHLNLTSALMFPSIGTGLRHLPTDADALANAQVSQMTNIMTLTSCPGTLGGSPLTTTFANDNGGSSGGAVYFELECLASSGLTIPDIALNVGGAGGAAANFNLYLQMLSAPNTTDPIGFWGLPVATGAAASTLPAGTPTHFSVSPPLQLGPGCRVGVAIAGNFAHAYTNGSAAFQVYSTADLTLAACCATNSPFTAPVFSPRVVNTSISYNLGGVCPPVATCVAQGNGCVKEFTSFYEVLTATGMDLSGRRLSAINTGTLAAPSYDVTTVAAALQPIGSVGAAAALVLADDQVVAAGTLGLQVSSNCQIFNGPGGTPGFVPTPSIFLGGPCSYTSSWTDLNPAAPGSGQVFYEQNAGSGVAQITYNGVYGFGTTGANTVQFRINTVNGSFSITWGALATTNVRPWLVGFSPAAVSLDPGPTDISATPLIHTFAVDNPGLGLVCANRPAQGGAWNVTTTNIPANAFLHLRVLGLNRPGVPLGIIGFPPSCTQLASPDVIDIDVLPSPAPSSINWTPLPSIPAGFIGFEVNAQAVTLFGAPLFNLNSRASNGLKGRVGAL